MKFSARLKLVPIVALLVMMLAGSAWASVADVIDNYGGGGLIVNGTGADASNPLIITGEETNVTSTLNIDTTGLTIEWKAKLSGTTASLSSIDFFTLVSLSGSGTFKITGGEISLSGVDTAPTGYPENWPIMIKATDSANIAVSGGTVNMALSEGTAIDSATEVEVTGGAVKAEHGTAISAPTVDVQDDSGMHGSVFHSTNKIDVYGICSFVTYDVCNWENLSISTATLKDGASVTFELPIIGRDNVKIIAENGAVLNSKFDSAGNIEIGATAVTGNIDVEAVLENDGTAKKTELEKSGVPSDTIIPLEVFKAGNVKENGVFLRTYKMELDEIAGYTIGELRVIKLVKGAAPAKLPKAASGSIGDGEFSVYDANGVLLSDGHEIVADVEYLITIGIADEGPFDWADDTAGTIIDPVGIGAESGGGTGGGGGGCNVGGYGVIALLLAAVGLVTRKARKV